MARQARPTRPSRPRAPDRPPVRRHHRRRHGAAELHAARSPHSKVAEGAAAQLANKMGMDPALVVHGKPMGPDFTFFVVYGRVNHLVDTSKVEVVERDYPLLTPKEANAAIKRALRRRLVVVGACIGTDAHTVGIDAILNIKGFAGEKGLEYYREVKVVNLGAQVSVPQLVERARAEKADAVLVSQVVTQRDAHLLNTREMSAAFRESYPPAKRPLLVVGGPRFDEAMADELGVDRVFGRGTTPGEVASFLVHRLTRRSRTGRLVMADGSTNGRGRHPRGAPPLRALLPRPLRRQPRRRRLQPRACSATWPPRCASAPTATRACSRRTPTCSSAPRCAPATCSRSPASSPGSAPGRGCMDFAVHVVARGAATAEAPGAAAVLDRAAAGHHGDRHRRRPRLTDRPRACRRATRRADTDFRNLPLIGGRALTCASRVRAGQRRLTVRPRRRPSVCPVRLVQIVAGGPASEWPGRRVGCQPPVRPGSRRSVRSARADTEGARAPRQQPDLGSQSVSGWTEGSAGPLRRSAGPRLGTFAPVLLRTVLALVAGVVAGPGLRAGRGRPR